MDNKQTSKGLELYITAKGCLGEVLSDGNANFGCAITLNNLSTKAWNKTIGGGASTTLMYEALKDTTRFTSVLESNALPGDIIISPTGLAKDPTQHGHCGAVAQFGILSNSSEDGAVHEQWTIPTWNAFYKDYLGFPVFYFRAI